MQGGWREKHRTEKWLEVLHVTMEMGLRELGGPRISSRRSDGRELKGIATKFVLCRVRRWSSLLCM